jgi:hypothetical protein
LKFDLFDQSERHQTKDEKQKQKQKKKERKKERIKKENKIKATRPLQSLPSKGMQINNKTKPANKHSAHLL